MNHREGVAATSAHRQPDRTPTGFGGMALPGMRVSAVSRLRRALFGKGGGFVFDTVHNVQTSAPVENPLAMLQSLRDRAG